MEVSCCMSKCTFASSNEGWLDKLYIKNHIAFRLVLCSVDWQFFANEWMLLNNQVNNLQCLLKVQECGEL